MFLWVVKINLKYLDCVLIEATVFLEKFFGKRFFEGTMFLEKNFMAKISLN